MIATVRYEAHPAPALACAERSRARAVLVDALVVAVVIAGSVVGSFGAGVYVLLVMH